MTNNVYAMLNYDKWNRRLINLLWRCNIIIFVVEIIIAARYYQTQPMPPFSEYFLLYIFIPSFSIFLLIALCELVVWILGKNHKNLQPYVIIFTSVAVCAVLLAVHYFVTVVFVVYALPLVLSLVYNNKRVLLYTYIVSVLAFVAIYVGYFIEANLPNFIVNVANMPSTMAILFVAFLIGRIVLNRQEEIINILAEVQRSAYETNLAKNKAEAAADARRLFMANMSHEIRTPMNGIIGLTELALDENRQAKRRDYLVKIKNCANGLLAIVNDILDISKIDAGELTVEKIPFDLHVIISECQAVIQYKADEKGLSLYLQDATGLKNKIIGDPTKLRQVLLNLLSNAVKFTTEGYAAFTASLLSSGGGKVVIGFEIKDSGIGMTEEQREVIFEPFKQADDSTTRKYGGTGLGLFITNNYVEMMGGSISIDSIPNKGSKFSFKLEFELAGEKSEAAINGLERLYKADYPVLTGDVLVCEDNEINRQVAVENLARAGLNVTVAVNGKECVEIVRSRKSKAFDLIFMDIHMPVMDGIQAVEELKKMGVNTPVIAMTANVMLEDRERYMERGMSGYLSKPFKSRELLECLLKFMAPVEAQCPVDEDIGKEYAGDMELYEKLLADFLVKQPETPLLLETALENKDFIYAKEMAHSTKSTALVIGAVTLSHILGDLEKAFEAEEYDVSIMEEYKKELDRVLKYITTRSAISPE